VCVCVCLCVFVVSPLFVFGVVVFVAMLSDQFWRRNGDFGGETGTLAAKPAKKTPLQLFVFVFVFVFLTFAVLLVVSAHGGDITLWAQTTNKPPTLVA